MGLTVAVNQRASVRARKMSRIGIWAVAYATLATATAQAASRVEELPNLETWGKAIAQAPLLNEGCFTAEYPDMQWKAVKCGRAHVPTPTATEAALAPA